MGLSRGWGWRILGLGEWDFEIVQVREASKKTEVALEVGD
jgi:hypothetical protein